MPGTRSSLRRKLMRRQRFTYRFQTLQRLNEGHAPVRCDRRVVEPDRLLLRAEPPQPKGGRPRVSGRAALNDILYVLRTGIQRKPLPAEPGFGSGVAAVKAYATLGEICGDPRDVLDDCRPPRTM
jgi:hypothetical protein